MAKIHEDEFIETNEQYGDGIAINIYNSEYSLVAAKRNKNGDIWAEWCFPQKYVDGKHVAGEKSMPRKLSLGTKEQAIRRLNELIMMIEGRDMELDEPF